MPAPHCCTPANLYPAASIPKVKVQNPPKNSSKLKTISHSHNQLDWAAQGMNLMLISLIIINCLVHVGQMYVMIGVQ